MISESAQGKTLSTPLITAIIAGCVIVIVLLLWLMLRKGKKKKGA